jgi:AraC family transcriptional regulator
LGKIAPKILATGDGWSASDVVCTFGPQDRPFEEQHGAISIAVVVEGSFQYRSGCSSEVMSPGSLMLGNYGQSFECGHEHGTGDRCVAFHYTPEFFELASATAAFPVCRLSPMAALAPWVVEARLGIRAPERVSFEDLAAGLAGEVLGVLGTNGKGHCAPTAADERRISAVLRFIEANLGGLLPLELLASVAKMSAFHFCNSSGGQGRYGSREGAAA